jgi:hypothetical protein
MQESTSPAKGRSSASRRAVNAELLDVLPADDPRARRSRRDLRRVNACMGNPRILTELIRQVVKPGTFTRFGELGGGDGVLMLRVAQRLERVAELTLVDRQNLLTGETIERFSAAGWTARAVAAEVFDWLNEARPVDVMVANLFLHHFEDSRLVELFGRASGLARVFIACEPRRFSQSWVAGLLVGLLGCNAVTRHDATASVRAGFLGSELSSLWPAAAGWRLEERNAGLFSHTFVARRR